MNGPTKNLEIFSEKSCIKNNLTNRIKNKKEKDIPKNSLKYVDVEEFPLITKLLELMTFPFP